MAMKVSQSAASELSMEWTYFRNLRANQGELRTSSWLEFCDMIRHAEHYGAKNEQPLLKLGSYENNSRAPDSQLIKISGIEVDYDAGKVTLAEAQQRVSAAKIEAFFCSTYNSKPEQPKWRLFVPLSQATDAIHRASWVAAINQVIGNIAAKESFTPKQIFFFGRGDGDYQTVHCQGEYLNRIPAMQAIADDYMLNGQAPPKPKPATHINHFAHADNDELARLERALSVLDSADTDTWTEAMFGIAGSLGEAGYSTFDTWSASAPNYNAAQNRKRYLSCIGSTKTVATVFSMANQVDRDWNKSDKTQRSHALSQQAGYHYQPDIKHQRQQGQSEGSHVKLVAASLIAPKRLEWLWPENIPKNALSLFVGMPKTGKTMLLIMIVAIVSSGGKYPDGTQATIGKVLFWTGEDDIQDTILPRLKAAGANLDNVMFVNDTVSDGECHPFSPADDMALLLDTIERMQEKPVLLVVDPIVSVVKEMNNALEVRRGLEPLRTIAQNYKMAVVGITHFRKSRGESGLGEQIIGSSAFLQVPRVVFYTLKVPDSDGQCVFFRGDTNMAASDCGFTYAIESTEADFPEHQMVIDTATVTWGSRIEGDDLQMLISPDGRGDSAPARLAAEDMLKAFLAGGEQLKEEIDHEAKRQGITTISLTRAKKALGIKHRKRKKSESSPGKSVWYLADQGQPDQVDPVEKGDQVDCVDKVTEA